VTDWNALQRLADQVGTVANPACILYGRNPPVEFTDNGGAQARCIHSDDAECVVTSDGVRHTLT
jgi:hypothetical protein